MPIKYHPKRGTIVICDFSGFQIPEMTKRRPVIVVSPRLKYRPNLCTVIPLSTTKPNIIRPYHYQLCLPDPLPYPYDFPCMWVKGDMLYAVSFKRLSLFFKGRKQDGKRNYLLPKISDGDFRNIEECLLNGLGIKDLTQFKTGKI